MKSKNFTLGFKPTGTILYEDDVYLYINTHYLVSEFKHSKDELFNILRATISSFDEGLKFVSSGSPLNQEMIKFEGWKTSHEELDIIKKIFCEIFLVTSIREKVDWVYEAAHEIDFSSNELYIRYGNVELRVLENFLRNRDSAFEALEIVFKNLQDESFIFNPMKPDDFHWLSASDHLFNLKALMTNAGFFISNNLDLAKKDLVNWCTKYIAGLNLGKLFVYPGAYPFFWNIWHELDKNISYVHFPDPEKFFKLLAGKKVLIVSPFKELLDRMVFEGRLKNLYTNFLIDDVEFIFIQAPMSIYPHRPGDSWSSTYDALFSEVSGAIKNLGVDIFMASCGCYGIPLTTDVHKTHNISSVYYGNHINTLLGIRQACSINHCQGFINENLRLDSDLGKFKNLSLIDGGRYI